MCIFETPPCIYYLSDKNLEDEEYLKLFTLFGAIFDAPPNAIGKFTSFLKSQEGLSPRAYKSDEIVQMRKKIIRPHAKRVNPYGCYDITRYGTFFNVNVPKSICQGCPYSVSYKNARREKENMVIAAILQNGAVPDRIRMQMELSGSKAAENIMHSIFMIQGKGAHRGKFDMIGLNAFLLFNLCSNNSLSAFESMENMTGYIKNRFKNDLLKSKRWIACTYTKSEPSCIIESGWLGYTFITILFRLTAVFREIWRPWKQVFTKTPVSVIHMLWDFCQEIFKVFIWSQVICFGCFGYAVYDGA